MALSKQQVSNLRKELRENHTVNNAVTLSAEKRSTKIAKLQQYLDTMPEGAPKTLRQNELEKFKSFTGLIAASEQEAQTTRGHVTTAVKDSKDEISQGDIQPLKNGVVHCTMDCRTETWTGALKNGLAH